MQMKSGGDGMSDIRTFTRRATICLSAAATAFAFAASAQTANMAGKTVEWTIPFSEKGGSAKWAYFFAPLLSEALPGKPTVVVKFMPGAGSTKGANWFQRKKGGDGTVMFGSSGSTQFPYLLDDPRVKYEYKDWNPVMATGTGGVAYLQPGLGAKFDGSANKLKDVNFIYGSQGATRLDLVPLLAWKMLGLKVEPVFGIKGRGDGRLMFERGEANIDYQTSSAYLKAVVSLVKAGKAVPMMSWGSLDAGGNIVRDPTFPDIPTFKEVCEKTDGCEPKGEAWDAWKAFFTAGFPVQKIAFLPAGTPQSVIETFVEAFAKVKARNDFAKISAKRLGKYPMFVGKDAAAALGRATSVPASAKAFVVKWLKKDYGVGLK
jgi:putative tricarboxylic transport membrane protein